MKKMIAMLLCVVLLTLAACSKSGGDTAQTTKADASSAVTTAAASEGDGIQEGEMPTVLNTAEYTLYQNIFMNEQMDAFDGKETEKEGTFATLTDAYNNVTRYYVWGYNDNTKCCDWQWELKIEDTSALPQNGSLVKVKGTYAKDDAALDKFWITSPEITVEKAYEGHDGEIDMLSMSNTLERVQATNIAQKKEAFEGKTVCGYGRMKSATAIEDAYYDNSWELGIETGDTIPAFGTVVLISGTVRDGKVAACSLSENTQY